MRIAGIRAEPAWERLRAPAGARLRVAPPERRAYDVLELSDSDVAELAGATAFLVERTPEGFEIWAARIDADGAATTYQVTTKRLRIRAADAALARHLGFEPSAPPTDVEWTWLDGHGAQAGASAPGGPGSTDEVICPCRGITRRQVEGAVSEGWRSVDAVKRATKATFGECQSRQCAETIAGIIGLEEGDRRSEITPRPPLVPVPASILAAFVPQPGEAGRPSPLSSPSPSAPSDL